jgi:hypothetical protein
MNRGQRLSHSLGRPPRRLNRGQRLCHPLTQGGLNVKRLLQGWRFSEVVEISFTEVKPKYLRTVKKRKYALECNVENDLVSLEDDFFLRH